MCYGAFVRERLHDSDSWKKGWLCIPKRRVNALLRKATS